VEPVDLAALAREVAAAQTAAVLVDAPARAVVSGRATGLTAAVDNLVLNAVQHAAPGSPITIAVEPRGPRRARRIRFAVRNEGVPLDAVLRARVWDRFFTTRASSGGAGLGLAIVRSVAAIHGGACGCDADPTGNTFWFEV
jgi:signal transduction histidine kinase